MLFSPASPGNAAKDIYVPLTVVQQGWFTQQVQASYLGGVACIQRVFGHQGLQGRQGQVPQVLLVLESQPQLSEQKTGQKVLPAELPGQTVLWHQRCKRTKMQK